MLYDARTRIKVTSFPNTTDYCNRATLRIHAFQGQACFATSQWEGGGCFASFFGDNVKQHQPRMVQSRCANNVFGKSTAGLLDYCRACVQLLVSNRYTTAARGFLLFTQQSGAASKLQPFLIQLEVVESSHLQRSRLRPPNHLIRGRRARSEFLNVVRCRRGRTTKEQNGPAFALLLLLVTSSIYCGSVDDSDLLPLYSCLLVRSLL